MLGRGLAWFMVVLLTLWAAAALYFDLPVVSWRLPAAVLYGVALLSLLVILRAHWPRIAAGVLGFGLVLAWWLALKPSNDRAWQPDVAQTAWAEIAGSRITIHNFRNCDYRTEGNYVAHWDTKTVDLAQLRGVDIFLTHWGSAWIAHPIVSFDFGGQGYVAISIETRKETTESYSAVRGFFRYYELIYLISDERDVVRLRTNYRKGEDVYLYHTRVAPQQARIIFRDYLERANRMREQPEWYNALTNNCTTNIAFRAAQTKPGWTSSWDWRMLLNGHADEMLYERGDLAGNLPFAQLKQSARINPAAQAADTAPDFSRRIRDGRPGFQDP
jgi:hypothetical protein